MNDSKSISRSWALLFARLILGLIFFMVGFYKVFQIGPIEHVHNLFIEPYSKTFLPTWMLWIVGIIIPFIELVAGAFVILGFRIREALISIGFVLVIVTFGHLLIEPFYEFHTHVIPRLALMIFILVLPSEDDRFSIDYSLIQRKKN